MKLGHISIAAAALSVVAVPGIASASVILADTFTQNPGNLANRPVEVPQTTGDKWNVNNSSSSACAVSGGSLSIDTVGGFAKAICPFDPTTVTQPYTLQFTLDIVASSNTKVEQLYGGFGNGTGNGSAFIDNSGGPMFHFNGSVVTGTSATLDLGTSYTQTTYAVQLDRATTSDDYIANIDITIDPNAASNNVTFSVNGTDYAPITYSGAIAGLWFKGNGAAAGQGMKLSNFSVSAVPEPASLSLLAIGGLPMFLRRRRRSVRV